MDRAFEGLRVLDFTQGIAGPYASMQLAALGATVIKVEPRDGDYTRGWSSADDEPSPVFETLNRNKQTVRLDLRDDGAIARVRHLATLADVLIEDLGEGVMVPYGLGYCDLSEDHPALVYVSVSAFGDDPSGMFSRMHAGSELVLQAAAGCWDYLGTPGEPPLRLGADIISTWTGIHAFQATLAALYDRERTGAGQKIELDMLRSLMSMYLVRHYTESPDVEPNHWLSRCEHPDSYSGIYPLWQTADVPMLLEFFASGFILDEDKWRGFFEEVGIGSVVNDPRFDSVVKRRQHWREIKSVYAAAFAKYTAAELQQIVMRHGGVGMPANTMDMMAQNPQVQAMDLIAEMTTPHGAMRYIGLPWEFSEIEPAEARPVNDLQRTDGWPEEEQ